MRIFTYVISNESNIIRKKNGWCSNPASPPPPAGGRELRWPFHALLVWVVIQDLQRVTANKFTFVLVMIMNRARAISKVRSVSDADIFVTVKNDSLQPNS